MSLGLGVRIALGQIADSRRRPTPDYLSLAHQSQPRHVLKCRADATQISTPRQRGTAHLDLKGSFCRKIKTIGRDYWEACHNGSNPFVCYDFLDALEKSGSVGERTGWMPYHLVIFADVDNANPNPGPLDGEILACVPMYLKGHSYGEYVFDSGWAEAFDRGGFGAGQGYYPKLQCCVPFTPVTGPRVLLRQGLEQRDRDAVMIAVAQTLRKLPEEVGVSGIHMTFNTEEEATALAAQGFMRRVGVQYWWHNRDPTAAGDAGSSMRLNDGTQFPGGFSGVDRDGGSTLLAAAGPKYESFDGFLAALQQKRRKAIRQERKKVAAEGLCIRRLSGADVQKPALWDAFYDFYCDTVNRKWGMPYLTREFFELVSESMADRILLVTAEGDRYGAGPVAAALNFVGADAIYGRNWGCAVGDSIKGLHFELCFYQVSCWGPLPFPVLLLLACAAVILAMCTLQQFNSCSLTPLGACLHLLIEVYVVHCLNKFISSSSHPLLFPFTGHRACH